MSSEIISTQQHIPEGIIPSFKHVAKRIIKNILPEWVLSRITHAGFRRYFKNTGWMFVGQVATFVATFFVSVAIARYLGPAEYGVLSYVVSFVGLFGFVANFGIDSVIIRELIDKPERKDSLLGTSFFIKLCGAFLAIVLVYFFSFILQTSPVERVLILLFSSTLFFQAFQVSNFYFSANVLSKKNSIVQIISLVFTSIFRILLIYLRFSIGWFIFSYVLDSIILAVGFSIAYKNIGFSHRTWNFDLHLMRKVLKSSLFLVFSAAATTVYLKIDQVMIKQMIDAYSVGVYAVAAKLSELWFFVPGIICSSLFPAIINARKTDKNLYYKRLRWLLIIMIVSSLVISLFMFFGSDIIVNVVFGSMYAGAVPILQIYVWGVVGIFLWTAFAQYLIAEDYTSLMFYMSFMGAVVNIVLNFILIPRIGMMGAAIGTLISYNSIVFIPLFSKKIRSDFLNILGIRFSSV